VTESRHDASRPVLDHTHSLARRIGLAQLPLACIVARFLQDAWFRVVARYEVGALGQVKLLAAAFLNLFLLKVLTGVILAGICAELRIAEESAKATRKQQQQLEKQQQEKQKQQQQHDKQQQEKQQKQQTERQQQKQAAPFELSESTAEKADRKGMWLPL
jgi:Mg-chelatase subunit ChlI